MVKTPAITGGVDTHADVHVAAALDGIGGLLGVSEFPAAPAGYAQLLGWLTSFGTVCLVGIEGTGSYGAGLVDRLGALGAGGALGDHQRPDRLHLAVTPPRCACGPSGQGRAGGADRVQRIRLALAAPVLPV